ncbi:hypothetical protein [Roseiconus lacunae]|uniref:Uncharacterized protein n=1 Tax=Roseiconus lacunae TaxID=2605694 RepID=A0ABT7PF84_9BACT|nr:hypothetical protein [Roseiconus lacunae]MDM4014959.1 hypothetical protein [Roseiconus lacunae]
MYPRNAAAPERVAVGAVVQISDGAVQTSGVSITVRKQSGAEAAGGGTVDIGSNGTVYYTPTQAETDATSFTVEAFKAGCLPRSITIVTSADSTPGKVSLAGTQTANITGNLTGNVTGSIGSLGAQAKADVNAECDTAIADYDAPTKAELDAAQTAIVSACATATGFATPGDAMTLTAGERTSLAAAIEAAIINELDGTAVMQAIADLIADDMTTGDLSVQAIAAAVRDAILDRVLAGNHDTAGTPGKLLQDTFANSTEIGSIYSQVESDSTTDIMQAIGALSTDIAGVQSGVDDAVDNTEVNIPNTLATLATAIDNVFNQVEEVDTQELLSAINANAWSSLERQQLRYRLGIDGSVSTPVVNIETGLNWRADWSDEVVDACDHAINDLGLPGAIASTAVTAAKMETMLQSDGDSGFQFTILALTHAPAGGGGGGGGDYPTPEEVATAVVDALPDEAFQIVRQGPDYDSATKTIALTRAKDYRSIHGQSVTFDLPTITGIDWSSETVTLVFSGATIGRKRIGAIATKVFENDTHRVRLEFPREMIDGREGDYQWCLDAHIDSGSRVDVVEVFKGRIRLDKSAGQAVSPAVD